MDRVKRAEVLGRAIKSIEYSCQASRGAILAATSPAQLHTLKPDNLKHLRLWLCKHGMDLFSLLEPGQQDPLFIVTGLVTSSSWAAAAYPQARGDSHSHGSLVLSRFSEYLPQKYRWTRTSRQATTRSKASPSGLDSQGEMIKDQCLFLRGFLITPSPNNGSHQARRVFEHRMHDLYPSYRINKQLLELVSPINVPILPPFSPSFPLSPMPIWPSRMTTIGDLALSILRRLAYGKTMW